VSHKGTASGSKQLIDRKHPSFCGVRAMAFAYAARDREITWRPPLHFHTRRKGVLRYFAEAMPRLRLMASAPFVPSGLRPDLVGAPRCRIKLAVYRPSGQPAVILRTESGPPPSHSRHAPVGAAGPAAGSRGPKRFRC
jgi:hypothetical protein